jgi:hypothetical protein
VTPHIQIMTGLKLGREFIANFNETLNNTYNTGGQTSYWQELHHSKFILCPSGLGWDTYCSCEALVMGAIPIWRHTIETRGSRKHTMTCQCFGWITMTMIHFHCWRRPFQRFYCRLISICLKNWKGFSG